MKTLSEYQLQDAIGPYIAPVGHYESLPFLGTVTSDVTSLIAGQCTEIMITYTVGGSGLVDGSWIKAPSKSTQTGHSSKPQIPSKITMSQPPTPQVLSFKVKHLLQSKKSQ
jgi:hypothetical protein